MEPLFRAISITAPETDLNSFDIITDRRNLRLLMDFVSHRDQHQQEFRFDVEVLGNNTVIFSSTFGGESRRVTAGYGKEFKKNITETPNCSTGSLVHKRAVGYTLDGLRLMVRYEVNACLEAPEETTKTEEVVITPDGHRLILKGALSKAEGIVELRTTAITGRDPMGYAASRKASSQMWLSMTPILCQGFHRNGVFERIEVSNVRDELKLRDWEKQNYEQIGKLVQVLRRLKAMIKAGADKRFALLCEKGGDCLKLCRLEDAYSFGLPQDLRKKWGGEEEEGQLEGIMERPNI
jgi:hypothetical protein